MNDHDQKQVIKIEFIGLKARIIDAKNEQYVGIEGTIIDETKNFIIVQTKIGKKNVAKKGTIFEIGQKNCKIKVHGNLIEKRPEDRIKI